MSEAGVVRDSEGPRTRVRLAEDLRRLGLAPGMTVLVHASLSALGWVNGGPVAVIQALQDVLTADSTLMMPSMSSLDDPAVWQNPPIPEDWWQTVRETMPGYDPRITPTRNLGQIAELFRTWPGVLRSDHPSCAFAAWGHHAAALTRNHALDFSFGDTSPLGRLYERDAYVLLLGVGFDRNTSFHLAEYRVTPPPAIANFRAPVLRDGRTTWVSFRDVTADDGPFAEIGRSFMESGAVTTGQVGSATTHLFRQCPAVDHAVAWLSQHRSGGREPAH